MIGIINYGLGNLSSVSRALERLGVSARIISGKEEISSAEKLILPGVGHAVAGMAKLQEMDIIGTLNEKVLSNKTPILGICLGMQLMTVRSEEGDTECLGWFDAETVKFPNSSPRIPHMGWNSVVPQKDHPFLAGIDNASSFYFAHSYYVGPRDTNDLLATTNYQVEFASVIGKENIFGVQFHPERSHDDGLRLLKNFANL